MTASAEPEPVVDGGLIQVGHAFKAAMAAARRLRGRETHRPGAPSYAQYSLLFELAHGELSSRELGEAADLSPATVTQLLDNLAAHGLVERIRSDQDKRVVLSSLTARGRMLVERRRVQMEQRWAVALAEFEPDDLRAAAAVLERLTHLFDEFTEE